MGHDQAFSFHAALACIAGVISVVVIGNRCFDQSAEPPQAEVGGRPTPTISGPIKFASAMAMFWGIAGFTVGLIIWLQLAWPALNLDLPWTTFGRLRPLHTSAVIFAFGGNVLIATSFYVVQKTCRTRLAGDLSPWFVVVGYNRFLYPDRGYGLSARRNANRRSTLSRNGTPISGPDDRLGDVICSCS